MLAVSKPIVMVSSTVYGSESLLDVIFGMLDSYGYTVWMSHKGSMPLDPNKSNLDNCLNAVRNCNLFFGIINGRYGSVVKDGRSTTHHEVIEAVGLNKLRWFAVHQNVEVARVLLKQYRSKDGSPNTEFTYKSTPILDDIRILDMYDEARTPSTTAPGVSVALLPGRWVQPYNNDDDLKLYVNSQFGDINHVRNLLNGTTGGGTP